MPNKCVISTEILTEGGKRLAVALNTLSFEATGEGTTLKVTVQLVSFVGPGMVEGYESGNKGALEGLAGHLSANSGFSDQGWAEQTRAFQESAVGFAESCLANEWPFLTRLTSERRRPLRRKSNNARLRQVYLLTRWQ